LRRRSIENGLGREGVGERGSGREREREREGGGRESMWVTEGERENLREGEREDERERE